MEALTGKVVERKRQRCGGNKMGDALHEDKLTGFSSIIALSLSLTHTHTQTHTIHIVVRQQCYLYKWPPPDWEAFCIKESPEQFHRPKKPNKAPISLPLPQQLDGSFYPYSEYHGIVSAPDPLSTYFCSIILQYGPDRADLQLSATVQHGVIVTTWYNPLSQLSPSQHHVLRNDSTR